MAAVERRELELPSGTGRDLNGSTCSDLTPWLQHLDVPNDSIGKDLILLAVVQRQSTACAAYRQLSVTSGGAQGSFK